MGKEMSKILPGIYVGRLDNAQNDNDMMANCITHILSVHEPVKQKLIKSKTYKYFEVNVKDDETALISKFFSKTNEFIHEARVTDGNVLIHCLAGVSRAPTIVLAYLMTIYDLTYQEAFSCLRVVRPNINPNKGFIHQLIEFEESEKNLEKKRLFDMFGVWKSIEDDEKIIKDLLLRSENQEPGNYNINDSSEFGCSDGGGSPFLHSYGSEGFFGYSEDHEVEQLGLDGRQSEPDDDVDVPGSIPIGGSINKDSTPILGTSTADYRGRAHSRQSTVAAPDDQLYSLSRYGSTAPPAMPLYSDQTGH